MRSAEDALRARQAETEKTLRRWRLVDWPRHEKTAAGSGTWETLAVDLNMLARVKSSLDTHLGLDAGLDAGLDVSASWQAEQEGRSCKEVADKNVLADKNVPNAEAEEGTSSGFKCAEPQSSTLDRDGEGGQEMEREEVDLLLVGVSELAGKVLAQVAADEQKRFRAEQLRLLAEAEAQRKRERVRRQLGDAAVSSSNIISQSDRPERRSRKVINYAQAEKDMDRQLKQYAPLFV